MGRLRRRLAAVAVAAGALGVSGPGRASPEYPGVVQEYLHLGCPPTCTLCHSSPEGGYGTVTRPFGRSARSAGLEGDSPEGVGPMLEKLRFDHIDSDRDGAEDAEEIVRLDDPNSDGDTSLCGPEYGCASVAGVRVDPAPVSAGLALLGLALLARRRARRA